MMPSDHPALIGLTKILARQAVKEFLEGKLPAESPAEAPENKRKPRSTRKAPEETLVVRYVGAPAASINGEGDKQTKPAGERSIQSVKHEIDHDS